MSYMLPPPAQPDPTSLYDQVDWLTYSHQQLYDMVHNGMDLAGGHQVADAWTALGQLLSELATDLANALSASAHGWQGSAAEAARTSIGALADWAQHTGGNAHVVGSCVSSEVANAQRAKDAMPAPVPAPVMPTPSPGGPGMMHPDIMINPYWQTQQQQQAHQQAAQVLSQFQTDSRDVYGTVPQFAAPTAPVTGPPPTPQPGPTPQPTQPGPGPLAGPPPLLSRLPTGSARGAGPSIGSGAAAESGELAGARSGASAGRSAAGFGAAEAGTAETAGRGGSSPGFGGMGSGARRGEDKERRSPAYLTEDDELFTTDEVTAPPVIGGQP